MWKVYFEISLKPFSPFTPLSFSRAITTPAAVLSVREAFIFQIKGTEGLGIPWVKKTISSNLVPKEINPNNYLPFSIPGLEIIISIIFIIFVGSLSLSFIGKRVLNFVNDLFKKIPILRTIYSAIGQMTQSFAPSKNKKKSVVLIEYPRKGVWAVGFATKDNKGEINKRTNKN